MTLMRYQPWGLMRSLHNDLDRLFEQRLGMDETAGSVANWTPPVDIKEEENRFVLHADIPGVKPEDIEVTMENGVLTITGSRAETERDERQGYRRVERVAGRFFRRFTLPDTANAEGIAAKSTHGVLEVIIPKHERVMPRRISVNVN
jgi:HSP20 family protein